MPYYPPPVLPASDSVAVVKGSADPLKLARFEVDGFAGQGTHVYTLPDADTTLGGLGVAQTWTAVQTFATTDGGTSFAWRVLTGAVVPLYALVSDAASKEITFQFSDPASGAAVGNLSYYGPTNSRMELVAGGSLVLSAATGPVSLSGTNFVFGLGVAAGTNAVRTTVLGSGTAPTTYPADCSQEWVADISALNAAWHDAGEGLVARVHVGSVTVRQKAGTPGTHEGYLVHNGTSFLLGAPANANLIQLGPSGLDRIYIGTSWLTDQAFTWMLRMSANDGTVGVRSAGSFGWSSTANSYETSDTGLYRAAAGVVKVCGANASSFGRVLAGVLVEANTAGSGAPNVLTAVESRTLLTNEGATAQNYHTLPSAAAGYDFEFVVQDSDGIRVVASSGDTIRDVATVSATAGFIQSTTLGSVIRLKSINATEWVVVYKQGTWTIDS